MAKDSAGSKSPARPLSPRLLSHPHLIDCESLERVHPLARQFVDMSKNNPQICQKHSFRHGARRSGNSKTRQNDPALRGKAKVLEATSFVRGFRAFFPWGQRFLPACQLSSAMALECFR